MKKQAQNIAIYLSRHDTIVLLVIATIVAVASLAYNFSAGTILAYGDAESHINIAKRVVSGITPGFGQLGGIWLPLHHLIMVPFVINDFMWRTGLGGAIASAICYVASVFFVYKLAGQLIKKQLAVIVATLIYGLNPNIIYMLATPMSELPLLAFMTGSLYFFIRWVLHDDMRMLILAAVFSFCAVLIRYDAWFLVGVQFLAVLAIGLHRKYSKRKTEGLVILYILPPLFAAALWLLWGLIIFHDPLYFMNSEYSAKSQQLAFLERGELLTYHDAFRSIQYYIQAIISNVGIVFAVLGLLGGVAFIVGNHEKKTISTLVILTLLLSPLLFNVLALYLGISILFVPEVTPPEIEYQLFNIRYGMMMIPTVALFVGFLVGRLPLVWERRIVGAISIAVVVAFSFTVPITFADSKEGLSARRPQGSSAAIEREFNMVYDYGYVAFDDFGRSAQPVDLLVPMNKMIYVGNHPYWESLIENPQSVARFVIMQPNDALGKTLGKSKKFLDEYELITVRGGTHLYKCAKNCEQNPN